MIHVKDVTKQYGDVQALRGVSFEVSAGEIVGLLGPNGAGKTTIIKILTGYLQPDEGDVQIDGLDVLTNPREVQTRIGYLPENAPLYPELTVQAYLKLIADLRQVPLVEQAVRISEAVRATALETFLTRPIGKLSKGMRQRVGLAQAILHQPKLLILDEPTVGLDPTQIVEVRRLIRRLAQHSTVLFSSHILSEVEALCHRAIIIMNGRIRSDARLADLEATDNAILVLALSTTASGTASGTTQHPAPDIETRLKQLAQVRQVEPLPASGGMSTDGPSTDGYLSYRVYGNPGADVCPAVYEVARQNGWPLRELRRDARTLETVFNELATSASADESPSEEEPASVDATASADAAASA
ncbi:MAG: ABC transporter ATP-binding protein [Chloroflexi bacterium]|nr:ABC transporter ATP-binding protein [Chloroflexota bacterium]